MVRQEPGPYEPHPAMTVLATYYNAGGYRRPRENFLRFIAPLLRGGVRVVVVEGRYDGVAPLPAEVAGSTIHVPIDCESRVWQKERLLNVGLDRVPDAAGAIAWLDGDVVFSDPRWIPKTVEMLAARRFVQPFEDFVRLPERPHPSGGMFTWVGYGYVVGRDPSLAGAEFGRHGHTGLAWAARHDVIGSAGFYDRWPAGTGDHLMAHAMTGTADSGCIREALGEDSAAYRDFSSWADGWRTAGADRVGSIPGAVVHLWHGDHAKRSYPQREEQLRAVDFDAATDLTLARSGAWRASVHNPGLTALADGWMHGRAEDG